MNPALSVILFTTLSGMGYGLWLWLGLRIALGPHAYELEPISWVFALLLAFVLTSIGIVASLWHLGKPLRVWRAFSQWRTSWMSREGVMALASLAAAVVLIFMPLPGPHDLAHRATAALLALCALGTVCSTAMIYASLKTIPAWRHPLVLPGYIGFALLSGGLAFAALPQPLPVLRFALPVLLVLAVGMALLKLAYWRAIDRSSLPQTRGDAVGLPNRKASVFERPNTEANYITREMAFAVARKFSSRLRLLALLLFAAIPVACIVIAIATSQPWPWLVIAVVSAIAGTFIERWLFFAQAKHLVTLYY